MEATQTSRKTVLLVDGMSCGSCVRHVESALRGLDGVRGVEVRLQEGKAVVEHDRQRPSVDAMMEAVREAGYEPSVAVQG